MTDKYDCEGIEHGSRPTHAGAPSLFRGPHPHGLQVFGWFGNTMSVRPRQRSTFTRSFHGPRRDY
jgi:hypothetical protein